jgi:hypothetical protein
MAATYEPIATQTLGSAAASVTFSSISASYTDLVLVFWKLTSAGAQCSLQFNGDTGSNYSNTSLSGNGSTAASARASSGTSISLENALISDATNASMNILSVMNYSNTTTNKTIISRGGAAASGVNANVGLYRSTSAISSLTVLSGGSSTFSTGATFTLYGIKAA